MIKMFGLVSLLVFSKFVLGTVIQQNNVLNGFRGGGFKSDPIFFGNLNGLLTQFTASSSKINIYFSSNIPDQSLEVVLPRIFHFVSIDIDGYPYTPEAYKENREQLLALHPSWIFIEWTQTSILELIQISYPSLWAAFFESNPDHVRDFFSLGATRVNDFIHALILNEFGGAVVDPRFYLVNSLEILLKSFSFVMGRERSQRYAAAQGLMASAKNYALLSDYIAYVTAQLNNNFSVSTFRPQRLLSFYARQSQQNPDPSQYVGANVYDILIIRPFCWKNWNIHTKPYCCEKNRCCDN